MTNFCYFFSVTHFPPIQSQPSFEKKNDVKVFPKLEMDKHYDKLVIMFTATLFT